MKTAINEMIDIIDKEISCDDANYSTCELMVFIRLKNACTKLLDKEKEQIISAFTTARSEFDKYNLRVDKSANEYFKQKFSNASTDNHVL